MALTRLVILRTGLPDMKVTPLDPQRRDRLDSRILPRHSENSRSQVHRALSRTRTVRGELCRWPCSYI
jgi:hypothetical protein